jgi:hypothetical protein
LFGTVSECCMRAFFCCFLITRVAVVFALGQTEQSAIEKSLRPAELERLVAARKEAQQELDIHEEPLPQAIARAFLTRDNSVAIVKMAQVLPTSEVSFKVTLELEKLLRGTAPSQLSLECYWSDHPWALRVPLGAQRIKPVAGRRMLASFSDLNGRASFAGILNLDDPKEAGFLPQAMTIAKMEIDGVSGGIAAYKAALDSEASSVRDVAFQRLLPSGECAIGSDCERSLISEIQHLLRSGNPHDRMQAVRWLGDIGEAIGRCEIRTCEITHDREPVRRLLQTAMKDANVVVGDRAFQYLATLNFHTKDNAGYCEEIVPAVRRVQRYQAGGAHWIGGRLDASSTCVGAIRK